MRIIFRSISTFAMAIGLLCLASACFADATSLAESARQKMDLGLQAEAQSEKTTAKDCFLAAIQDAEKAKEQYTMLPSRTSEMGLANLYPVLGLLYYKAAVYKKNPRDYYKLAEENYNTYFSKTRNNDEASWQAFEYLIKLYESLGTPNPEKAEKLLKQALGIDLNSEYYQRLSQVFNKLGYQDLAKERMVLAKQYVKQKTKNLKYAELLISLGDMYLDSGNFSEGLNAYQSALDSYNQYYDKKTERYTVSSGFSGACEAKFGKARCYIDLGQYQEAKSLLNEIYASLPSGSSTKAKNDPTILAIKAKAQMGLGETSFRTGSIDEALDYCNAALATINPNNQTINQLTDQNKLLYAKCKLVTGQIWLKQPEPDLQQAKVDFDEAAPYLTAVADKAELEYGFGLISAGARLYREAKDHYLTAIADYRCQRAKQAPVYYEMGKVYRAMREDKAAEDCFLTALVIIYEFSLDQHLQGDVLTSLMKHYYDMSTNYLGLETGRVFLARAIVFGKLAVDCYQDSQAKLADSPKEWENFHKDNLPVYRQLIEMLADGRPSEAVDIIDLMKGSESYSYVKDSSQKNLAEVDHASYSDFEITWKDGTRNKVAELLSLTGTNNESTVNEKSEDQASASNDSVIVMRDQKAIDDARAAIKEALKAELKDNNIYNKNTDKGAKWVVSKKSDTAALYGFVGEKGLIAILVTQKGCFCQIDRPTTPTALSDLVRVFRGVLQDCEKDPKPYGSQFYRRLIQPFEDNLNKDIKTLLFCPDGDLRYVPLAALFNEKFLGGYLIRRFFPVVLTPNTFKGSLEPPSKPFNNNAAFAMTKADEPLVALPCAYEEITSIFWSDKAKKGNSVLEASVIKKDENFTLESFYGALSHKPAVVHLATHFVLDNANPEQSYLLLGDKSHLPLGAIEQKTGLFSSVKLLTLSACNTAYGIKGADGKEVDSLAVLAQKQGAESVIASLWEVPNKSTTKLMKQFYYNYFASVSIDDKDKTKAGALAMAQRSLLPAADFAPAKGKKIPPTEFQHPYYWAPFIVMGNWL